MNGSLSKARVISFSVQDMASCTEAGFNLGLSPSCHLPDSHLKVLWGSEAEGWRGLSGLPVHSKHKGAEWDSVYGPLGTGTD